MELSSPDAADSKEKAPSCRGMLHRPLQAFRYNNPEQVSNTIIVRNAVPRNSKGEEVMKAIDAIEVGHRYDLQVLSRNLNGLKVRFGDNGPITDLYTSDIVGKTTGERDEHMDHLLRAGVVSVEVTAVQPALRVSERALAQRQAMEAMKAREAALSRLPARTRPNPLKRNRTHF